MTVVGVFFGGRSVEHEVSVLTAMQVIAALPEPLTAVPVYIAKSGAWYTGEALRSVDSFRDVDGLLAGATRVTLRPEPDAAGALLDVGPRRGLRGGGERVVARIDVALPLVHGSSGEDGTLPGLFELAGMAYCGSGVAACAVSMDKRLAKRLFRTAGLRVVEDELVDRDAWRDREAVVAAIASRFGFPIYIKPLSLGSSIGVSRVTSRAQLEDAIELALRYDTRCLAEPEQEGAVEINCAVLGRGGDVRASACEQPKAGGLLSYEDKYLQKGGVKGGAGGAKHGPRRTIPAPLPDATTRRVQEAAMAAFRAVGAEGVARVDFLVRPGGGDGDVVVNEINTVPGSLSFYLWEPLGMTFADLLTRLVALARERRAAADATTYSIDSWLLTGRR